MTQEEVAQLRARTIEARHRWEQHQRFLLDAQARYAELQARLAAKGATAPPAVARARHSVG